MTDTLIDRMARAYYASFNAQYCGAVVMPDWDAMTEWSREQHRTIARAALTAIRVPIEINVTPEMIEAGVTALLSDSGVAFGIEHFSVEEAVERVYRAMVETLPPHARAQQQHT